MPSWVDLNERQQQYLQAIYDQNQENKRHVSTGLFRGRRTRPAAEWRWMCYGIFPETGSDSPLRHRLKVADLVDPGTEATFEALEKRGYILCRYKPVVTGDPLVYIQITPKGRKLVRTATSAEREKSLPVGTLRKGHWRAMVVAWKGRPEGVQASSGWRGDYGNIPRKVWLCLRDYQGGALIETHQIQRERRAGIYTPPIYWLRLTPLGEQYYCDNWQRYHELYPDVDAPAPREPDQTVGETASI